MDRLQPVDEGIEIVEALGPSAVEHNVDVSTYRCRNPIDVALLRELRTLGHEAEVTITSRGGLRRVVDLLDEAETIRDGPDIWGDLKLDDRPERRARAADKNNEPRSLLEALEGLSADLTIWIRNDPGTSGVHWIATCHALRDHLADSAWVTLLAKLRPRPERPVLVLGDIADGFVCAPGLCIVGRDQDLAVLPDPEQPLPPPRLRKEAATVEEATAAALAELGVGEEQATITVVQQPQRRRFRKSRNAIVEVEPLPEGEGRGVLVRQAAAYDAERLTGDQRGQTAPYLVQPSMCDPGSDAPFFTFLEARLRLMTQALAWVWLAEKADVAAGRVSVAWSGGPNVDLTDPSSRFDASATATRDAVELWRMAIASTDELRRESVQQSIQALVHEEQDLRTIAPAVLRRARFVLKIAEQHRTGEAMASLRAARQSAVATAAGLAEATRGAAKSVVDRVFASVVAAFGILLSNKGDLINDEVAIYLFVAVMLLILATAVIALVVEYPNADSIHEAGVADLDRYRDLLDPVEIDRLKKGSLEEAERQLSRSRGISLAITGLGLAAAVFFLILTLTGGNGPTSTFPIS